MSLSLSSYEVEEAVMEYLRARFPQLTLEHEHVCLYQPEAADTEIKCDIDIAVPPTKS